MGRARGSPDCAGLRLCQRPRTTATGRFRLPQRQAHHVLVARGFDRLDPVVWQTQRPRELRGEHGRIVVDADDGA